MIGPTSTKVTCLWYWDQVWYRPLFCIFSFYQDSVTEIQDEIINFAPFQNFGSYLSSPQPLPSLIDFFALVYSSDVYGPVLMFKSVKTGSVASVSLLKLEELPRRPLKWLYHFWLYLIWYPPLTGPGKLISIHWSH